MEKPFQIIFKNLEVFKDHDRIKEPRALISNVGDEVVNQWITNQHYVLKRNKLMDVNKMNRIELRQTPRSRRLTGRKR